MTSTIPQAIEPGGPALPAQGTPWAVSLNRVLTLAQKELYSYFYSPIAYVVMVIYLLFAGWFFFSRFFLFGQLEMLCASSAVFAGSALSALTTSTQSRAWRW